MLQYCRLQLLKALAARGGAGERFSCITDV